MRNPLRAREGVSSKEIAMDATRSYNERPPTQRPDPILEELRAIRAEQQQLRRIFDHFADVFLNAKFPFGKPTDRWARR
jgi:hypothetical protein